MQYLARAPRLAAALSLAAVLATGCGGGGGGAASSAATDSGFTSNDASTVAGGSGGTASPGTIDIGAGAAVSGASGGGSASTGTSGSTGTSTGTGTPPGTSTGAGNTPGATGTGSVTPVGMVPDLPPGPRALVLYDAPAGSEYEKLGFSYAIMLRNLLGHFNARVDLLPVQQYTAGQVDAHDATFYLGASYANPLPAAFLADAAATDRTLVWFKYNLWEVAGDPAFNFAQRRGFDLAGLRGLNAAPSAAQPTPGFFDTVSYKSRAFVKYYAFDAARGTVAADPEIGITAITDPSKASALATIANPVTGEQAPYIVRSGKFWYVADMPFSFIGPRDRYLVVADLLHDMLGVQHTESHQAMVRLEDVNAKVSVQAMQVLSDYLHDKQIPFSIAAIPHYVDPLGADNDGVPQEIPLAQATNLRRALDYAVARGGEVVMHGYTHQYGAQKNPWTGISGDDYEFWNIVTNTPVAEDSTAWALGRLGAGLGELSAAGYRPVAWETPHYHASATDSRAFTQLFGTTYQRVVYFTGDTPDFSARPGKDFSAGQIFPYVIHKDYYGQRVLPENVGNIEYDIHKIDPASNLNYSWQDLYLNAQYALTVRDGYASFFFHPFWAEPAMKTPGLADFKSLVEGITQLGYTWVAPSAAR